VFQLPWPILAMVCSWVLVFKLWWVLFHPWRLMGSSVQFCKYLAGAAIISKTILPNFD
jgi:hypothetical protein